MKKKRPVCDVCGKPATNAAQDIKEILTKDGTKRMEPLSPPNIKYGCDFHPAESEVFTVWEGLWDGVNLT